MHVHSVAAVSMIGQQLTTLHARVCGSAINTQAMQANYRRRKVVTIILALTNASDSKGGSLKGSAFFSLSLVSFTSLVAASKNKPKKIQQLAYLFTKCGI